VRRRRDPEIISGRMNADGTIAAGDGFTCVKGAAGNYTLRFPPNFIVVACCVTVVSITGNLVVATPSGNQVTIQLWSNSAVATDMVFSFIATGPQR